MEKINLVPENFIVSTIESGSRKSILVTDKERLRPRGYKNEDYIKWLNYEYLQQYGDILPYHYVITSDGALYNSKEDFVSTRISAFAGLENEAIILLEGSLVKISEQQKNTLNKLCALICQKYFLTSYDIKYYPYDILNDDSIVNYKASLQNSVRTILNERGSSYILQHSFLKEQIETGILTAGAKFVPLNRNLTVKEISEMTGIPQNILLQQNEYLL